MTTRISRGAVACALLATTCLVSPAFAQSAPPPRFQSVDDNGVDLISGTFNFSLVEGSIGAGEGGLTLEHGPGAGKWSGLLYRRTINGTPSVVVEFGLVADTFLISGTTYTSTKADGATLVGTAEGYRYTAADGTKIDYRSSTSNDGVFVYPMSGPQCQLADAGTCAIPVSIQKPDGMVFTLNWDIIEKCDYGSPRVIPEDGSCPSASAFFRFAGVSTSGNYGFTVKYQTDIPGNYSVPQTSWYKKTGATFTNLASAPPVLPTSSYTNPAPGVEEVTDMGGRVWRFTSSGSTYGIRRPGAASDNIVVTYAADGKVASVTRDGVLTRYARIVSGTTATMTITNALNQVTTVVSDLAIGRPTSVTDALGRATAFAYDASGRPTGVTRPEGDQTLTTYDGRGNVTQTTAKAKPGSGLPDIVTTADYDATCGNGVTCNQPNWTKDATGNQTYYAYDATTGHVTSVTAPAAANGVRPQTRYAYGSINGVSLLTGTSACQTGANCTGSADEVRTSVSYNANLLPISASTGAGDGSLTATSTMGYDPIGNMTSVDGPLPGSADTSVARYNGSREVVGTVGPDPDGGGPLKPRAVRATRDAQGQVVAQETGTVTDQSDAAWGGFASLERVDATLDANGRAVKQVLSGGGAAQAAVEYSYDAQGRPECTAQRMNPAGFGALTNACSLGTAGSFGPDRITRTVYDAVGQVTATQVAVGTTDAATESASTYTPGGKLASLTDGENNRTSYVYDGFDRLSRTIYPVATKGAGASNPSDYEELGYDIRSLVTSRRVRDGQVIGYGYDALGRPTSKDVPNVAFFENDASYAYDNLGRLTGASDSAGLALAFSYDALGRMLTNGSNWYGTASSQYDIAGRRTRLTWKDGFFVTYDYLTTGETATVRENGSLALATFGYDDLGRRASLTRGNGTVTSYGYDPVSRLSQLTHDAAGGASDLGLSFSYNPASQIATNTRTNDAYSFTPQAASTGSAANGLNQLTQLGSATLSYDGRGNLINDGAGRTFAYTAENLLATSTGPAGPTNLAYDPLGRLIHLSGSATDLLYDGGEVIQEVQANGGPSRAKFVHGPGVDETLVVYDAAGRHYAHADERGSVIALSDDTGNVTATNRYDEYGTPASTNVGRFQYTGQMWLPEIGAYNYKARMYDPKVGGRFMQPDPIGNGGGPNLYNGMGGDPVNFTDPSGLCPSGEHWESHPTGSRIPQCVPDGSGVAGGQDSNHAAFSAPGGGGLAFVGSYQCVARCDNPSDHTAPNGNIVVYAPPVYGYVPGLTQASGNNNFPVTFYFSISPQGPEDYLVPGNALPLNTRFVLSGRVVSPNGIVTINLPPGFIPTPARNGQGIVFRAPFTQGDANIVRIASPNAYTPYPYIRFYNNDRQAISPFSGRTTNTHYRLTGMGH